MMMSSQSRLIGHITSHVSSTLPSLVNIDQETRSVQHGTDITTYMHTKMMAIPNILPRDYNDTVKEDIGKSEIGVKNCFLATTHYVECFLLSHTYI